MRIAYIINWRFSEVSGITGKFRNQVNSWLEQGHEVKVFPFSDDHESEYGRCYEKGFWCFSHGPARFIKDIIDYSPDMVYLRYEMYKPYLGKILHNHPTVVEINGNDIVEMKEYKSIKMKIKHYYNLLSRKYLFSNCKGIVSVSEELIKMKQIADFNKPAIAIPNSRTIKDYPIVKQISSENSINLFYLTSASVTWMGVDKLLKLAPKLGSDYHIHIIGLDNSQNDIANLHYHGYLSRDNYQKVMANCQIALGTMALHRKKMNNTSAIKVVDCLAYGFPMILPYKDTAFLAETPDWILEIPNNDEWVNDDAVIAKIKDFCIKYKDKVVTHEESRKYIDSQFFESQRLDFFKKIIEEAQK